MLRVIRPGSSTFQKVSAGLTSVKRVLLVLLIARGTSYLYVFGLLKNAMETCWSLAEMGEGVAHWRAGDMDQPVERLVELQDQEDRA